MTDPEADLYARPVARIGRSIVWLSAAGCAAAMLMGGWRAAAGFLVGALASWLNFRWLRRLVEAFGPATAVKPPRARVAVFLGLRYLILGAGAYVILNFSALNLRAAFAGLFVAVAAVMIEILFELVYARN